MRPHPRNAQTDATAPRAWGTCQRCGFIWNLHTFSWQYEWRGTRLENTKLLVCDYCLDEPQRQLGTVILPPDPVGILNARPEAYYTDEQTYRVTMSGVQRYQMDGVARIESNVQSGQTFNQALATQPYTQGIITSQNIHGDRGEDIIFNVAAAPGEAGSTEPETPANAYVTEDQASFYVTEDSATFYVQE